MIDPNIETFVHLIAFLKDAGVLGVVVLVARALYLGDLISRSSAQWFIREVVLEVLGELETKARSERRIDRVGRPWDAPGGNGSE